MKPLSSFFDFLVHKKEQVSRPALFLSLFSANEAHLAFDLFHGAVGDPGRLLGPYPVEMCIRDSHNSMPF